MVIQFIAEALRNAEELKQRVILSKDIVNDTETTITRLKLQKLYQQVLLLDLEYAIEKKVEQDLWNIGFKNYIDCLQKLVKDKKNPKRSEHQGLLNICLESASGFYTILLEEICVTFSFNLPFPSYRKYSYLQSNVRKSQLESHIKKPKKASCCYICQHCLVHLGDIGRYRFRCKQAEIFYRNAMIISPSSGQPYNQLALLETCRGNRLATVFYYIRSITVRNPFPAAASNLSLTLKKANVDNEWNVESEKILSTAEFITLFLKVHAILHLDDDVMACADYIRLLSTSLTAHVATESFTSINLVQLIVINMFVYHNITAEGRRTTEDNQSLGDEKTVKAMTVELIAGFLNAYLLPVYTYKQDDSLLQYFALPAIKITLDWIRIHSQELLQSGFADRPQIWPALCKLLNELGPFVKSFPQEKYKNVTLPEDQDVQGFIPLQSAIPEFKYTDSELDLDTLSKLRASRVQGLALWIAKETKYSLLEVCEEENGIPTFKALTNGPQLSNDLIIQQLEELLKNDCNISSNEDASECMKENHQMLRNGKKSLSGSISSAGESTSPLITVTENNRPNKRAGILKTHSFLDKKEKNFGGIDVKKHPRQNVALQTILKRNQEQEHKQVTFKTPSPSLSAGSDLDCTSPSVNHSQLWPNNAFGQNNLGHTLQQQQQQQQQQQKSHSVFMPSFPPYGDAFRSLQPHSTTNLLAPQPNASYTNPNTTPLFQSNVNTDLPRNFTNQMYQKPFVSNDRIMEQFSNTLNGSENRHQNVIDPNMVTSLTDNRHLQRNQFNNNQISNLNFLPTWKQESNPWWVEDNQKVVNSNAITNTKVLDDQANSLFHFRNSLALSSASQSSGLPFNSSSHIQYQPQQPPPSHQIRQIPHQSTGPLQQQLPQQPQQTSQGGHLRSPNTSNVAVGYWPNTFKQSPPQSNLNSIFNTNVMPKQPVFDNSYNTSTALNSEDKAGFQTHSQLPNNTYSLFSPMWNNSSTSETQPNQSNSNNPLAVFTHQSIWSEGVSPLQRLLEQQKQMRDRSMYHGSQLSQND